MVEVMKFNRLIAFGCSNTYGHGLPDCVTETGSYGPKPSNFAYPIILANSLGISTVINLAEPGASNKQIAKKVIDFEFHKEDLVVVGWSFIERDCLFLPPSKDPTLTHISLGVSQSDGINTIYQKRFFNYYDRTIETGMFSSLAAKHIKQQAGQYLGFFCCIAHRYFDYDLSSYEPIIDIDFGNILNQFGRTKDNFHPNLKSHQYLARKLEEILYEYK